MPQLSRPEERYRADLQRCQVVAGATPSYGIGSAYFWFYPNSKNLHYSVYHDLTVSAIRIALLQGDMGVNATEITTKRFYTAKSYARGIFVLTNDQWASLVKGSLSIQVYTPQYPFGHLRGQILCYGKGCTSGTVLPYRNNIVTPCTPPYKVLTLFNDGLVYVFFYNLSDPMQIAKQGHCLSCWRCGF